MKFVCVSIAYCRTDQHATLLFVYPIHQIWKLLAGLDWGSGSQESKQHEQRRLRVSREAACSQACSRMNLPFQALLVTV